MSDDGPTLEEWRRLYEASVRVHELAPWQWMEEDDLFGVQSSATGQTGFVSVMGMAGEHFALGLYLGSWGLYSFWDFHENAEYFEPQQLFEIPQLQVSFENRSELHKQDHEVIKQLGLKFRGSHAWPMFRSIRPGYLPWFITADEGRFLVEALDQVADVAARFKANPALLDALDDDSYLIRVRRAGKDKAIWEDEIRKVKPEGMAINVVTDQRLLDKVKTLPRGKTRLEIDLFPLPAPIHEKGARPYMPYMLMVVDAASGMILGADLLQPEPTLDHMWGTFPLRVLNVFARLGAVPQEIRLRSSLLTQLTQDMADELQVKLKQSSRLAKLEAAQNMLGGLF